MKTRTTLRALCRVAPRTFWIPEDGLLVTSVRVRRAGLGACPACRPVEADDACGGVVGDERDEPLYEPADPCPECGSHRDRGECDHCDDLA